MRFRQGVPGGFDLEQGQAHCLPICSKGGQVLRNKRPGAEKVPDVRPGPAEETTMKVLVIYASVEGQTAKIAGFVAEEITGDPSYLSTCAAGFSGRGAYSISA